MLLMFAKDMPSSEALASRLLTVECPVWVIVELHGVPSTKFFEVEVDQ